MAPKPVLLSMLGLLVVLALLVLVLRLIVVALQIKTRVRPSIDIHQFQIHPSTSTCLGSQNRVDKKDMPRGDRA